MQTRQTQRKTITLAGRYFSGAGEPVDVLIRDLSIGGCRFDATGPHLVQNTRLQIFLEGSGPHYAMVKWAADGEVGITFITPLSEELFARFQNSHVALHDKERTRTSSDFDPMPQSLPRRFC